MSSQEYRYVFGSAEQILKICKEQEIDLAELMLRREAQRFACPRELAMERMRERWDVMRDSARTALTNPRRSMGGLIGGEAKKLQERLHSGHSLMGGVLGKAAAYAMSVMEVNAAMGLIVAAPTAGSAGVLPASLLAVQEERGYTDDEMSKALFVASVIGMIIMAQATVAGAEGGCQAEVGSASAMAAAALVYLDGGSPEQSLQAASAALANLLGLVCDPIGGLVELPCQRRNAIGAANAIISAESALAEFSEVVPFDEMVAAMYEVGAAMPATLRETALGGVAGTPSAIKRCGGCGACS